MTTETIPGQAVQYLVDPKNPATPCYLTSSGEVAQKRANKGDRVVEIDRVAHLGNTPHPIAPLHIRIHGEPQSAAPADDNEEL
jgi:hypothetical protein